MNFRLKDHHDDKDLTNLTKEVKGVTSESDWCVFCGLNSRKKRKRLSCDTYEEHSTSKVPKALKKFQKRMNIATVGKRVIDHLKCSK